MRCVSAMRQLGRVGWAASHVLWADHMEKWVIPKAIDRSLAFKKASSSTPHVAQGKVQWAMYMYGPVGWQRKSGLLDLIITISIKIVASIHVIACICIDLSVDVR
jgi:hypothetical protein